MSGLLAQLQRFNAKERYWLLAQALCGQLEDRNVKRGGGFQLDYDFVAQLGKCLDVTITGPTWAAMDYHLDWLYASVCLIGAAPDSKESFENPLVPDDKNGKRMVQGNQEDIDLLVHWRDAKGDRLVLVEVKGATGWSTSQLESKFLRLNAIFAENGPLREFVQPYFVLVSPEEPSGTVNNTVPSMWRHGHDGRVAWVPLRMPRDSLWQVMRCDENGRASAKNDSRWKTSPRKIPGSDQQRHR